MLLMYISDLKIQDWTLSSGMGHLRIFPEFRIFFFYLRGKKKPEPGKLTIFFVWEKLAV